MATLQQQISGGLLRPGGYQAASTATGIIGSRPLEHTTEALRCTEGEIFGTHVTFCPTPYSIVKKTTFTEPQLVMVGDRGYTVTAFWSTGTAVFFQTASGRIITQGPGGRMKSYFPRRHIVVSSNPRVRTLARASNRLKKLEANVSKTFARMTKARKKS